MSHITIEKVTEIQRFESLKEEWNNLLRHSKDNNIFLTWEWLFTWWKHYGKDKTINLLLIKDGTSIIGITPLMQSKYRLGVIEYHLLENICSINCEYFRTITLAEREEESIRALATYFHEIITKNNIIIRLSQVPENSTFISLLRNQLLLTNDSIIMNEKIIASCPYLDLPATWDEYYSSLSRKRRGNLRRASQSLQKGHTVELKRCKRGEPLDERIQRLFELHQRRWSSLKITSRFSKKREREYCIDISEVFHQNDWLELSSLTLDGKTISTVWGFTYNNCFYYMTPAFDMDYSSYSIGNLHILNLIELAINNGVRCFDFLRGDEVYKHYWTHSAKNNLQIVLMKRRLASGIRSNIFDLIMRFDQIRKRNLRENYYLYLDRKRQDNATKAFNKIKETS